MAILKTAAKIAKNQPLHWEEAFERLKKDVDWKLDQYEEALLVFRDLALKLHGDNEALRKENERLATKLGEKVATKVSSTMEGARDFVELAWKEMEDEEAHAKLHKSHEVTIPADDLGLTQQRMRTIKWLREKYGLPPMGRMRGKGIK